MASLMSGSRWCDVAIRMYRIHFIRSDGYNGSIPGAYFSRGYAQVKAGILNSKKGRNRIKGGVVVKVRYYVRPA